MFTTQLKWNVHLEVNQESIVSTQHPPPPPPPPKKKASQSDCNFHYLCMVLPFLVKIDCWVADTDLCQMELLNTRNNNVLVFHLASSVSNAVITCVPREGEGSSSIGWHANLAHSEVCDKLNDELHHVLEERSGPHQGCQAGKKENRSFRHVTKEPGTFFRNMKPLCLLSGLEEKKKRRLVDLHFSGGYCGHHHKPMVQTASATSGKSGELWPQSHPPYCLAGTGGLTRRRLSGKAEHDIVSHSQNPTGCQLFDHLIIKHQGCIVQIRWEVGRFVRFIQVEVTPTVWWSPNSSKSMRPVWGWRSQRGVV